MDWSMCGAAVATATVATVGVARFAKWRVNCWFCNGNQWVPMREKRQFTCEYCRQYNGFNDDGGYDKVIREQHKVVPSRTRYAVSEGLQEGGSDSPFCSRCEDAMEKRRRAIADWDAQNEDDWKAEYDEYTRRMERLYPLCERCEMNTQRRLTANKQRYKYLETLKWQLLNGKAGSIISGLTSVSRMAARSIRPSSRRRFFSGGPFTTKFHLIGMIISGLLMMTLTDTLLSDCGMDPLPLPNQLRWFLSITLPHSFTLSIVIATSHVLSFATNKNRISLPDLVSIPSLIWLSSCLTSPIQGDNALQSVAASSSLFLLLSAVAILPRKRKHKKRPNHIINSAFSVASTPVSQVSSQGDSLYLPSPRIGNWSPSRNGLDTQMDKTPVLTHNRFRERSRLGTPSEMEWEPSEACAPLSSLSPLSSLRSKGDQSPNGRSIIGPHMNRSPLSTMNGMGGWRETRREETPDRSTPAREIASQLSAFSMRDENEKEGIRRRTGGPFPSASSHFGVRSMRGETNGGIFGQSRTNSMVSFQSRTPSLRSLSRSNTMIPPSMARFNLRSSPSTAPSLVHSHLTSASQQVQESRGLYYLILILTFTSVSTFVGMTILFYHTFFR